MAKPKITFVPHAGQVKAWNSDKRIVAMIAGSGGGKSLLGSFWLLREIQKHPKDSFMAVAPTYTMLVRNLMPYIQNLLEPYGAYYRTNEKVWYLPEGGRVIMGSADNPLSLEGAHVRAAWLDEAGQMDGLVWDVVRRRTAFYQGRILITTTPYFWNWIKTEVYDKWASGEDEDIEVITFDSKTNPYFPIEEFERLRATMPDWKFKMFYEAQWTRPSGLVYADFREDVNLVQPFDIPSDWRRYIGVDFGFNNPCAAVWVAVDKDTDTWYVYREYKKKGKTAQEFATEISNISYDEFIYKIYGDPSSPQSLKELRKYFQGAVSPADNKVLDGIGAVTVRIRNGSLKIFANLDGLLDELKSYRWKMSNDTMYDEPVKENDHLLDALRYVIYSTYKSNNIRKIPVPKPMGW